MPSTPHDTPACRPRAVLFDAYGTLFDVMSVSRLADGLFPGHGAALARHWRDKQIEYSRLVSMAGRYRPFSELTRAALRHAALQLQLNMDARAEWRLLAEYERLDPFAENLAVLQALKARGIRAGVLSNGDPPMLAAAVRHAGFEALLDPLLSVHAVQRFKPDPAVYALGPQALALPAHEILFVSSNGWDAVGAAWFGYTTLWVNRAHAPPEQLGTEPHHVAADLRGVPDLLGPA